MRKVKEKNRDCIAIISNSVEACKEVQCRKNIRTLYSTIFYNKEKKKFYWIRKVEVF